MNTCLLHLGSILKAAEELSLVEKPFPKLQHIQLCTGLSPEEIVRALELEPNPLGWHLEPSHNLADESTYWVGGRPCVGLVIERFA
ncbi:hypothetical protein SYN63AY4M2_12090 [Synechococcus sp. 63AY4M2]|jgi:hypothetical protein|uniref:hypothetical protein n=1 Tax=unclassified Synechococcus TaxID=2626047 RepID=UPI0000694AF5|nr:MULTISPECIES: hypothetical protein [unclassified Synechococcus]ABD01399.1 hypothetical protein CYB_0403 [Synechococcus sp. JA-2-3B'a(2-13)]PIK87091.1 hypothetical protein SYN63AY4M2_12090 [Synechococcus sp. 63AY4M2]PIK88012.1 hypothetical protein SYN65AY6A5_02370 [Synechococcus sp. 65AY6A5]PIK96162.1 hypothetical protein SYN60AY4M2_12720 [Synechococcus sp. 60AY4M2]